MQRYPICEAENAGAKVIHRSGGIRPVVSFAPREGINSLVQVAKAKARGYRSNRNLKLVTYLIAVKLGIRLST